MDPQRFTSHDPLVPGDPIFHPKCGFGTIHGLTRRDRIHPIQESAAAAGQDSTEDYYDIHLEKGGPCWSPSAGQTALGCAD